MGPARELRLEDLHILVLVHCSILCDAHNGHLRAAEDHAGHQRVVCLCVLVPPAPAAPALSGRALGRPALHLQGLQEYSREAQGLQEYSREAQGLQEYSREAQGPLLLELHASTIVPRTGCRHVGRPTSGPTTSSVLSAWQPW